MNHQRPRRGILAATVIMTLGVFSGLTAAHAQQVFIPCVANPGVMQTATTVTGTPGDDTIDCSAALPGKNIDGLGGNDTITGTAFSDRIDGGAGNDTITSGPAVSLGDDTVIGGV